LLAMPSHHELAAMGRVLPRGSVVALGMAEEVTKARQALADFDNIMVLDAGPDQIPCSDASFSKIVVPHQFERLLPHISHELYRLLAPGGEIIRQSVKV
jgi:hypothetical protein